MCKPITSDFDIDRRIKTPSSDLAQTITCLNSCACSLQIPQPPLIACYWWCAVFNAFYSVGGRYRDVESAEGGRSSGVPAPSSKPCSLRPKEMAHVISNKMLGGIFLAKINKAMSDIKLERTPSTSLYRYLQAELGALALNVSLLQAEQWRFSVDTLVLLLHSGAQYPLCTEGCRSGRWALSQSKQAAGSPEYMETENSRFF